MDEKVQRAAVDLSKVPQGKMTLLEKLEERVKDLREELFETKRLVRILKKNPKLTRIIER